jgi:3',5'-cyclic-AMP phosphodiesterase
MIKIGIISDIHYGPDRGTKRGSLAPELFCKFSKWAEQEPLHFIVDLGDRISDVDAETDATLVQEAGSWFSAISKPHYHLPGNHDLAELSLAQNQELLGFNLDSHSIDIGGWHFIFWNSGSKLDQIEGFTLSHESLDWLEADLKQNRLPAIVFTHVPLDNGSMVGNFYFEQAYLHHAHYPADQAASAREIMEKSGNVMLCVNGHTHWNAYHCIDGIHYATIPSLTELFPTYPDVCCSWSRLTIADDLHIQVFGNLPIEYRLPIRPANARHWLHINKAYAPKFSAPC